MSRIRLSLQVSLIAVEAVLTVTPCAWPGQFIPPSRTCWDNPGNTLMPTIFFRSDIKAVEYSRVSSLVTCGALLLQAVEHLAQVCGHQDMADLPDVAADIGRAANEVKLSVATK